MNQSQQMFHDFLLERVQPGKEAEAEAVLAESIAHQDNGTFTLEYMATVVPRLMALVRPECVAELADAAARMRATMT